MVFGKPFSRAVEYVHAGDIFQVNLAQRLLHRARCPAADLALHLRNTNPAPFAATPTLVVSKSSARHPNDF